MCQEHLVLILFIFPDIVLLIYILGLICIFFSIHHFHYCCKKKKKKKKKKERKYLVFAGFNFVIYGQNRKIKYQKYLILTTIYVLKDHKQIHLSRIVVIKFYENFLLLFIKNGFQI